MKLSEKILRTEYYESKIGSWVKVYEGNDMNKAMIYFDMHIIGNPSIRIAEYNKIGVRKVKYEYVRTLKEK